MEPRLVPVNGVLDIATADGLNPAPLAEAGWRVAGLEIPVRTPELGTVVIDVVLFNDRTGHLLGVEAKSGAHVELDQARRLAAVTPRLLVDAGAVTVSVPLSQSFEPMYACLDDHAGRILKGLTVAGLAMPVLVVAKATVRLDNGSAASPALAAAIGAPVGLRYPVASVVPFDHESPSESFDAPVRAELVAAMARGRQVVSMRHLTEDVVWHFNLYGAKARGRLVKQVAAAADRAAKAQPDALRFERQTGATEAQIVIIRSPETFDRRGRTQSYQAQFGARLPRRGHSPEVEGQTSLPDLLAELDQAEQGTTDELDEDLSARERDEEHDGHESGVPQPPPAVAPTLPQGRHTTTVDRKET